MDNTCYINLVFSLMSKCRHQTAGSLCIIFKHKVVYMILKLPILYLEFQVMLNYSSFVGDSFLKQNSLIEAISSNRNTHIPKPSYMVCVVTLHRQFSLCPRQVNRGVHGRGPSIFLNKTRRHFFIYCKFVVSMMCIKSLLCWGATITTWSGKLTELTSGSFWYHLKLAGAKLVQKLQGGLCKKKNLTNS